ncbi:MAG: ParB/RepB/Spo0J family partition protein [Planctomycetes bacterium]|nr:ParB/RepB/Spo0J family partition protein [Planctomycetota bacterium]
MVSMIEVVRIHPSPYQPRKHIAENELRELADSVRASGILQPILVRKVGDQFELVAGERRWRAAQLAGLTQIPALVRSVTDDDSAIIGLVENLQREDLNALEKAQGFQLLMKKLGATQDAVAARVGMERSSVANFLRLLDLPEPVQAHVSRGTLTMGHARALLGLSTPEAMIHWGDEAVRLGLSVRSLEAKVREMQSASLGESQPKAGSRKARPVWLNELEESLVESLGTPVAIRYGRKRSQIIIDCGGRDEFERIYQRLKGS